MENEKAKRFSKSQLKEVAAQAENVGDQVDQLRNMLISLSLKVFNMEKKFGSLGRVSAMAAAADYRSLALQKLLPAAGITEETIKAKILELQIGDFDNGSAEDDQDRNLVAVTDRPAKSGDFAIGTIRFYLNEQRLDDEGLVRTKLELGRKEVFPESNLDEVIEGASIGDKVTFNLVVPGKIDRAEFELLGLRERLPLVAVNPVLGREEESLQAPSTPESTNQ